MCDPSWRRGLSSEVVATDVETEVKKPTVVATSRDLSSKHEANTVLLQTLRAYAESESDRKYIRVLLDGGSQRTFIKRSLSVALKCKAVGEEELTIHTFGSGTATQRKCRRVQLWLRSQFDRNDVRIEALEMPEICSDVMRVPNNELVAKMEAAGCHVADLPMSNAVCNFTLTYGCLA